MHIPTKSTQVFSRIDSTLAQKTNLNLCKKTEIIPSIFSHHYGVKLEFSSRRKTRKFMNTWKLNSTYLNNTWIKEKILRKIRKYLKSNENGNSIPKPMGGSKSNY